MDADPFFEGLVVGPVEFREMVGLGRGHAPERLPGDIPGRGDLVVDDEDLLVVGKRTDGVAMALAGDDDVREDFRLDQRPDAVVDDDDVVVRALVFEGEDAVADRLLAGLAAGDHPLQLRDPVLLGVGPQDVVPAVDADDFDGVDARVLLEALKRVDEDGLVVDVQELLGDVVSHPRPRTARYDDGYCHFLALGRW